MTNTHARVGPYELLEPAGFGASAEVYRAMHAEYDLSVAVKIITGPRALDPHYRERFIREVQAVARLDHRGIVRVFDYGETEQSHASIERGSPYLIMEFADQGVLEVETIRTFEELRRILLQILDALAVSHARGVIHRDIKPGNVLLVTDESGNVRAKLTDFGIAHDHDPNLNLTRGTLGEATGTPDYMPPEQLRGNWREYGPWTDLYALGCMAWQLLTGALPFAGKTRMRVAVAHMNDRPPFLKPRFAVPVAFEEWLRRLLAKSPHDRFDFAADAAHVLRKMRAPLSADSSPAKGDPWARVDSSPTLLDLGSQVGDFDFDVDSMETTELAFSDLPFLVEQLPQADRAPMPSTWKVFSTSGPPTASGLGLGLFGLRPVPFVDRIVERDEIWQQLHEVENTQKPRAVILRGPAGVGKSRLAEWIGRRAREVGAATLLHAAHSPTAGAKHGLGPMLERYFVAWAMEDRDEVQEHIVGHLKRLFGAHADEEFLDHESRALAWLSTPPVTDGQSHEFRFSTAQERMVTIARLVTMVGVKRPAIIWLDDAQWGEEALALTERLLQRNAARVLLILTVQDGVGSTGNVARIAELEAHPSVSTLPLGPLPEEDQCDLIRQLLALDEPTVNVLARATAGNPLLAVQTVTDWVERGALVPHAAGFSLTDNTDLSVDLHELWLRRVDRIAARLGGPKQRIAIELAAVLGNDLLDVEWQAGCIVTGLTPHPRLVDELVEQGLVLRTEGGWSFVHRMLAESLRRAARDEGRWDVFNRCCGEILRTLYATSDEVKPRAAEHFVAAQAWSDALPLLLDSSRIYTAAGDLQAAAETLASCRRALDAMQVPVDDIQRADVQLLEANLHLQAGSFSRDERGLDALIESAQEKAWPDILARAHRIRGEAHATEGRLREALDDYEQAEQFSSRRSDSGEHASLMESRAWALKASGDTSAAREHLEKALDLYRRNGDGVRELNVFNRIAYTFLAEGDLEAAAEVAETGIEVGRHTSNRHAVAGCWTTLGEIARFRQQMDRARDCYLEAERLDELCGSRHAWVVRTNAAILEIAAGNWEEVGPMLERVETGLVEVGYGWMLPFVHLAQACCAANAQQWELYDRLWAPAVAEVKKKAIVERDVAWLAELCGELCEAHQKPARARAAFVFARAHWASLGDSTRAGAIRSRLRTNSTVG